MPISPLNLGNSFWGSVSGSQTEEQKILNEILSKTKTLGNRGVIKTDLEFIKNVVIPPLMVLREKWPDGYALIKDKITFKICECNFKDASGFDINKRGLTTITGHQPTAVAEDVWPDREVIWINRHDNFTESDMRIKIYHELMHAICNLAVKDGASSKDVRTMGSCLDEKYGGRLSRISERYMNDLMQGVNDFIAWEKENLEKNPRPKDKEIMDAFLGINDAHRCWAVRRLSLGDPETIDYYIKHSRAVIDDADEVIAWGLTERFGYDDFNKDNDRLREQEFFLHDIIERVILPRVKAAAAKSQKAKK